MNRRLRILQVEVSMVQVFKRMLQCAIACGAGRGSHSGHVPRLPPSVNFSPRRPVKKRSQCSPEVASGACRASTNT